MTQVMFYRTYLPSFSMQSQHLDAIDWTDAELSYLPIRPLHPGYRARLEDHPELLPFLAMNLLHSLSSAQTGLSTPAVARAVTI